MSIHLYSLYCQGTNFESLCDEEIPSTEISLTIPSRAEESVDWSREIMRYCRLVCHLNGHLPVNNFVLYHILRCIDSSDSIQVITRKASEQELGIFFGKAEVRLCSFGELHCEHWDDIRVPCIRSEQDIAVRSPCAQPVENEGISESLVSIGSTRHQDTDKFRWPNDCIGISSLPVTIAKEHVYCRKEGRVWVGPTTMSL